MKIKDELLQVASQIPGVLAYKYQDDFEANFNNTVIESNTIQYPFLQIISYDSGNLALKPPFNRYVETWHIGLYLCTNTIFDANTAENQDLIEVELKPLLREFIGGLINSDKFEPINRIDYKIQHYKFDYLVTGIRAMFSLTEKVGAAICWYGILYSFTWIGNNRNPARNDNLVSRAG